jgi:anti-sigma regulatory factor (Ser/Thr protein kinase)
VSADDPAEGGLRHEALFYRGPADCRALVLPAVTAALARAEPVLVAAPEATAGLVRTALDGQAGRVAYADMARLGRNPGRVIAALWEFAERHPAEPVTVVSELAWAGRSAAELDETAAHEAMINQAFAGSAVTVLCPYDASVLDPEVTASAARTHPLIRGAHGVVPSPQYRAGLTQPPLPAPPAGARCLAYTTDLRSVRAFVAAAGRRAGLSPDRTADLVLAVGEVAANTVRHAGARGTLHVWQARDEIVCQVGDGGQIRDPLAGRRRPPETGGLGLWVVHQVCDLVELRSGPDGTTIRMHMHRGGGPAARTGGQQ